MWLAGQISCAAEFVRILVIGGTGFIGAETVRRLHSDGHTVTVYHRGKTPAALPPGVQEIMNPESSFPIVRFPPAVFDFCPDVVIHTFAMCERDAISAVEAFAGHSGRLVVLSSGDVYRAYGRLVRIEPGEPDHELISEASPLRTVLYPYRSKAATSDGLEYHYEKILVEKTVLENSRLPASVIRLPKVYGRGNNADLATVYRVRHKPKWRWTHGYVENVAAAIALVATHPAAAGQVYNAGEPHTPTVAERLEWMPLSAIQPELESGLNFDQDIAYDTSRIRRELGYREIIDEKEAVLKTLREREGV